MPAQANTDSELRLRVVLVMVTGVPRSTDDEDDEDDDDDDNDGDDVVALGGLVVVTETDDGDAAGELLACTVEDVNELRPWAELRDTVRMDDALDSSEKVVDVMPCVSAQMASVQLLVIIVAFAENIDAADTEDDMTGSFHQGLTEHARVLVAAVFVPEHCVLVVQDVEHVWEPVEDTVTVEQMTVQDVTGDSEQELVEEDVSEEDDDPEDSGVAEEVTDPVLETVVDACEERLAILESDGV
ncbi:hypothetical protein ABEF95_006424 [Exophiala dermatitidis]